MSLFSFFSSQPLFPLTFKYNDAMKSTASRNVFLILAATLCIHIPLVSASAGSGTTTSVQKSYWYDWAYYGAYPRNSYESFGAESPFLNLVQQDDRCDDGLIFIEPRGTYVQTPGPVIVDNAGNLVWTETRWGQAMDLKMQKYKGKDYITFWRGVDRGGFAGGEGSYIMLDEHYEVFKEVRPIGGLPGDLHEFRIIDEDTIVMTMYEAIQVDMSSYGIGQGWIFDCLFQEINLETGDVLFQWRASDHFNVSDSMEPLFGTGGYEDNGFDYFHINSVDKDANGDYLISARHMCAVACISHLDGSVLWQLGGVRNSFIDLSDGAATNFTWNHHASWLDNNTLTVFDNGSNGEVKSATTSRGLMIEIDLESMTASIVHQYFALQPLLSPSQGSVQITPSDTVLVGWGHTPAFTEFTMDGEILCETHFGPIWFANFGWTKSYRTFKYPWVGRPNTKPDFAVRPGHDAVYVSWNGATEVDRWVMQSAESENEDANFEDHDEVKKTSFETRLDIPADCNEYLRVAALDADGNILGYTKPASRYEESVTKLLDAPSRRWIPEPFTILMWSIVAFAVLSTILFRFRGHMNRSMGHVNRLIKRTIGRGAATHKYEPVPSKTDV